MPTVAELLTEAGHQLAAQPSGRLDAEVLLGHVLGRSRTWLYTWPEQPVAEEAVAAFRALLARRTAGEPIAYLVGHREFWSLDLAVSPDTLIPRPETELLVEQALARIPSDAQWRVLDLGTGSGAIALAVASERPGCRLIATDQSAGALKLARANADRLGIRNVEFRQGHWLQAVAGEKFAIILSNPPYIRANDPHLAQGDVRFEPAAALVAGTDGLDAYREIIASAPHHLQPDAWLLVEHGYDQGPAVRALLAAHDFREVLGYEDELGHQRVAAGHHLEP